MDTLKAAAEYRLAQWGQVMQSRTAQGISIKEYCANAGISRNTYFYWQRKLREAACSELTGSETAAETGLAPAGWARLDPAEPEKAALTIEINGCQVTVQKESDMELLGQVCQTLKAL